MFFDLSTVALAGLRSPLRDQMRQVRYDMLTRRGPMVERDIDWRAPMANRLMQEDDL